MFQTPPACNIKKEAKVAEGITERDVQNYELLTFTERSGKGGTTAEADQEFLVSECPTSSAQNVERVLTPLTTRPSEQPEVKLDLAVIKQLSFGGSTVTTDGSTPLAQQTE